MVFYYDSYKIMVLIHKDLTEELFLEKAGAKTGYAKKMFTDMFRSITSEKIDVYQEYKKFYSTEYSTFKVYLFKKYNMKLNLIEEIVKAMEENPNCILYRKDQNSYGNWEISTFMLSETMEERISKILILK